MQLKGTRRDRFAGPVNFWTGIGLAIVMASAAEGEAAAPESAQTLRGTSEPLERHTSPLRHIGRGLLLVPYAGISAIAWPASQVAYLNERYEIAHRVGNLLTFQAGSYKTQLTPVFGIETGLGLTKIGGTVTTDDWLGTGMRLHLGGGYVSSTKNLLLFGAKTPEGQVRISLFGRLENLQDRPFYGIGARSRDDRFGTNREQLLGEAALHIHPYGQWEIGVTGYARNTDLTDPSTENPVEDPFPELADLARHSHYVGFETSVEFDSRDMKELSTTGVLMRVNGGTNAARSSGDADYRHYAVEGQLFLDLYRHSRILAFRAAGRGIDATDPDGVPYTELEKLGGKTGPRGYGRYRFTDRNSLLLTVEYRYPLTNRFQGRAFVDWGSVAPEWSRLRLADIDPSVGMALAVLSPNVPLTFHVARGSEGFELYLGTRSAFSYRSRRRQ